MDPLTIITFCGGAYLLNKLFGDDTTEEKPPQKEHPYKENNKLPSTDKKSETKEKNTKDILLLTKSAKNGGLCVAGIDIQNKQWIRLVSSDTKSDGALSKQFMQKDRNGYPIFFSQQIAGYRISFPKVVRVWLRQACPNPVQKENFLIDETEKFYFLRKTALDEIQKYTDNDQFIYGNTSSFVEEHELSFNGASLKMFCVENLQIYRITDVAGKHHSRASFCYNNLKYLDIRVTDGDFFEIENATFSKALIVVSLPHESFKGKYYKFIAKIFPLSE